MHRKDGEQYEEEYYKYNMQTALMLRMSILMDTGLTVPAGMTAPGTDPGKVTDPDGGIRVVPGILYRSGLR